MQKKIINPDTLPAPVGHFDRAVQLGPWLFISGTSALTHKAGEMADRRLSPTIEEQTLETLRNIELVCDAAGYEMTDIFEFRIVLKRRQDFKTVDAIIAERLPQKGFATHGYQGELLHPDMLIEIEAKAYRAETAGAGS